MSFITKIWLGGFLLLLPFFANPVAQQYFNQFSTPKLVGCFLLGNFLFANYLSKKIHSTFEAALVCFVLSVVFSGFGAVQMYAYAYFISALICFVWLEDQCINMQEYFFKMFVYGAIAPCLYALVQIFSVDPIITYAKGVDTHLPIAFFGQTTKFGSYLAICFGLAIGFRMYFIASFIGLMALYTQSSFVYLSLIAALIIHSRKYLSPRIVFGIIFGGSSFAACLYLIKSNSSIFVSHGREIIWKATIESWWANRPLTGFGPGSFEALFSTTFQPMIKGFVTDGEWLQAHNDYIQACFEFGLIGLVIMFLFFASIFLAYYKGWFIESRRSGLLHASECAFAAIFVNAFGNFPWQQGPHYFIGILCLAFLLKDQREADTIDTWPLTISSD